MKKSPIILLLTVLFCLICAEAASAQNTMTYAVADYDEATNTVYGYAYTEPDYSAGIYYTTAYVGAGLMDADGTQLG